ncbi:MAG TPA: hypothetical protein VHA11_11770 [Bryobacteraceae bacterium]|nr:hypothetical protein [Bryobacteraceae bacterium]
MFIGHFALGFAAKRLAPKTSLGWLMASAVGLDLLWPVFVLAGWEEVRIEPGNTAFTPLAFVHYPWTHSLLMAGAWGAALAIVYAAVTRYITGALVLGLCVVSHWGLDAVVHRPDLPLTPEGMRMIGLGLWNNVPATLALEGVLFALGVWLYMRASKPRDRAGLVGFWLFIAFLVIVYVSNVFGTPPPDAQAVAVMAMGLWPVVIWAGWFDAHHVYAHVG